MATRLRLNDGVDLAVDAPLEDVERALEDALANGGILKIVLGDGSTIVINAAHVLYVQDGTANAGHHLVEDHRLAEPAPG